MQQNYYSILEKNFQIFYLYTYIDSDEYKSVVDFFFRTIKLWKFLIDFDMYNFTLFNSKCNYI